MVDGLARVTVFAPDRRLDLAVPERLPVAELLPTLLRLAGRSASAGPVTGWLLRRPDGAALAVDRDLRTQAVRDGEVLQLVPTEPGWPEPTLDDPAEAFAAAVRRTGHRWSSGADRTAGRITAGVILAGGLVTLLAVGAPAGASPPAVVVPATAGLVALGLAVAGGWLTRRDQLADPDRSASGLLTGAAVGYAAVGAAAATAGLPVSARIAVVGAALTVTGAAVGVGGALPRRLAAAVVTAGGVATLAGATAVAGSWWSAATAPVLLSAVGASCLLVLGAGAMPALAVRVGRLPRPSAATDLAAVFAAAARADATLTGAVWAWSGTALPVAVVLVLTAGPAGAGLAVVVAVALLSRARRFAAVRHRQPMRSAGVVVAVTAIVGALSSAPATIQVPAIGLAVLLAVWQAGGAPRGLGRRGWEAAEVAAMVAVLPVAAAVLTAPTG